MLASRSLSMATMLRADEQPAMCWLAPEMPTVMYVVGLMDLPVRPTWWE